MSQGKWHWSDKLLYRQTKALAKVYHLYQRRIPIFLTALAAHDPPDLSWLVEDALKPNPTKTTGPCRVKTNRAPLNIGKEDAP